MNLASTVHDVRDNFYDDCGIVDQGKLRKGDRVLTLEGEEALVINRHFPFMTQRTIQQVSGSNKIDVKSYGIVSCHTETSPKEGSRRYTKYKVLLESEGMWQEVNKND